jgi:uncharacterized repeat protein (TIGR03803 family)
MIRKAICTAIAIALRTGASFHHRPRSFTDSQVIAIPRRVGFAALVVALLCAFPLTPPAQAQTYRKLYTFSASGHGRDPFGGLIRDQRGALYGTAGAGGAHHVGTAFKLKANGEQTVLHSFAVADGSGPSSSLIMDEAGNLYGTAPYGGAFPAQGRVVG